MDTAIVTAALAEAQATGIPIAELSLDRIARRAGVSRSTMFRRIRSRDALEAAVREAGAETGHRSTVRERAIAAATELIVASGVGALTLEAVARRANCAVTSVHTQLGGRDGLLAAVFERHAPLPAVEELLAGAAQFESFEDGVRAVYTTIFDTVESGGGVIEALLAETLAKPDGVGMALARDVVPRITRTVGGWLAAEAANGSCRDIELPLLLPLLIGPITVHLVARKRLAAAGVPVPDRAAVIETMTGAFCRAVGTGT